MPSHLYYSILPATFESFYFYIFIMIYYALDISYDLILNTSGMLPIISSHFILIHSILFPLLCTPLLSTSLQWISSSTQVVYDLKRHVM